MDVFSIFPGIDYIASVILASACALVGYYHVRRNG